LNYYEISNQTKNQTHQTKTFKGIYKSSMSETPANAPALQEGLVDPRVLAEKGQETGFGAGAAGMNVEVSTYVLNWTHFI
jgi:hypothetical protein